MSEENQENYRLLKIEDLGMEEAQSTPRLPI